MKVYDNATENADTPTWVCGHWNGSPLEIGMGLRTEVGAREVRHHHPYCEYFIGLEGTAEFEVEGSVVELRPGLVVMVEPGECHRLLSVDEAGARWIVIKEQSRPGTKDISGC
ncbi:MAG TPA: cupin domain-containing protein [Caldilineaceae bacterium]|nr:cupin domain-containing protein [Caldilineaceae bacterium]